MAPQYARCFKEKKQVVIENPEYTLTNSSRGQRASVSGVCKCGTKLYKFISVNDIPSDVKPKIVTSSKSKSSKKEGGARKRKSSASAKSKSKSRSKSKGRKSKSRSKGRA